MRRIKLVLALVAVLVAMLVATAGPAMADHTNRHENRQDRWENRWDRWEDRHDDVEVSWFFWPVILVVVDDDCDGFDDDGDWEIDEDGWCFVGFDSGFDLDLDLDDLGPDF